WAPARGPGPAGTGGASPTNGCGRTTWSPCPQYSAWRGPLPRAAGGALPRLEGLADPERDLPSGGAQVRDHGLAGHRGLALRDQRPGPLGQIDVNARAEADHADALAGAHARPLAHEADDPSGDKPGDLHHCDAGVAGTDHEAIALVVLARLVELGVEEGPAPIDDLLDLAG